VAPDSSKSVWRHATAFSAAVVLLEIGAALAAESLRSDGGDSSVGRIAAVSGLLLLGTFAVTVSVAFAIIRPWWRALAAQARKAGADDSMAELERRYRAEIEVLADGLKRMAEENARSKDALASEIERRSHAIEQLRLADRMRTVGALASGLAHELGTPLNVVEGHARLMLERPDVDPDVRARAQAIAGQAVKMTRLVRHLVDFARRGSPVKEPAALSVLVRRSISVLAPFAKEHGAEIVLEVDDEVELPADPTTLQQVITNLLVNAVQATPLHGEPITVEIVAPRFLEPPMGEGRGAGRYAQLRVTDHGVGIAAPDRRHIFEPFFTTRDVGEGTGLGLSIAYGIVQDHGGWITASSAPGSPTVLEVTLPAFRSLDSVLPVEGEPSAEAFRAA
jgi:signal transduction histidine kinase